MECLDFLSESPTNYIFQKRRNKTNFGGILSLLYIIVMILISLAYILEYAINEKYIYEGSTFNNQTYKDFDYDNHKRIHDDDELTPYINLTIISHTEDIAIFNDYENKFLELDHLDVYDDPVFSLRKKVSDIRVTIYYKCGQDYNCSQFEEFCESNGNWYGDFFLLYPHYKINHNEDPPVKVKETEGLVYGHGYSLRVYRPGIIRDEFDWEVIKYQDEKSLFKTLTNKKTDYFFGEIKDRNFKYTDYESFYHSIEYKKEIGYYIPIYSIVFYKNFEEYTLYRRRKIHLLDTIAKIGALFSTVKYFFSLFLSFYSKNADNYEVIEKLVNSIKEPIKKIELSKEFKVSEIKINKKENELKTINEINKLEPLIELEPNKNKENINYSEKNDKYIKDNKLIESSSFSLNKLYFYHFYFNNIYCKCCIKIKNQKMIDIANEILYKYLSIENLLYNQMKLENLFKDYKWINPLLNNIQNNDLMIKLKNS